MTLPKPEDFKDKGMVALEMTRERKKRFEEASLAIVDILEGKLENALEAYVVISKLAQDMKRMLGIKESFEIKTKGKV